jgi:hypothetical protein
MSRYDVTPDDDPLDLAAVGSDDAGVEKLRHALSPDGAVVWDDDDDELDPAFALLRALQADVAADLPDRAAILPPDVTELLPRRRRLGRGATIAAVAAGVLSIGGVAAAAPGHPLAAVGSAVSSAVSNIIDSITPDAPVGPAVVESTRTGEPTGKPTGKPTVKPTPAGDAVSDAARSASAVKQVTANLDRAAAFLDQGKDQPAGNQLDAAARKLGYVMDPATRSRLASRLASLRALLGTHPAAKPSKAAAGSSGTGTSDHGKSGKDNSGKGSSDSRPDATRTPEAKPTRSPRSGSEGSGNGHATETPEPKASKRSSDDSSD